MSKRLVVIEGPDQGQAFPLPEKGALLLGSSKRRVDFTLHDLFVSKLHCKLELADGRVVVSDLKNSKGTFLNNKQITSHEMQPGDVLRVGNSQLRLVLTDVLSPDAPSVPGVGESGALPYLTLNHLDELANRRMGHFRLGSVLGKGASGVVFQAQDLKNNQVVALKVFSPEFPACDPEIQHFIKVCKPLLALSHPHLVGVLSVGRVLPYCWMAREFVDGESLADRLRRLDPERDDLDWEPGFRLARDIGQALSYARQNQASHRDISPRNILLQANDPVARLADLMLAQALEGSKLWQNRVRTRTGADAAYLAPEQLEAGAYVDDSCDLYSLGVCVYQLVTGHLPYKGDTPAEVLAQVQAGLPVRPTKYNEAIPLEFETVLLKMLAKHQENRFQTPDELLTELDRTALRLGVEV